MEENNRIQNDEGHSGVIENTADTRINELQDEINLLKSQMEKLAPAFNLSKKMNAEKATDSIDFIADKINVMFIETMREDSVSKISFDQYKYSIENKFRQIQDGITSKIDTQKDSIDTRVGNMEDNQSNIEDSLMKIQNSVDKKVSQTDFEVYQFNSSKAHATKEEVAKLKAYLKLYVKTDDFGATQNSIDALKESMHNDYFVKSDVSQMLESVKEEMLSKTHQKQSYFENTVFDKFEKQQSYIKENASNIGKVNVELKKIHKMIGKIRKELLEKATFSDIEKVYQEMDKYCMYQHLEDLEAQVTPQIQTFSESVHQFGEKIIQIENIVQRFDEILLTKASKVTMESLKDTLHSFATKEELSENTKSMNEVNTKVKEAIAETNKSMEIVEKDIIRTLNNSISTISSKIMKEVQFKLNNKEAVTMEELEEKLKHKVGNAEFMHELDLKSNKNDTNTAMNSIEILHKQNKNICGIVMEALKQAADYFINTDESEKTLYEKRAQLHKHALRVSKWVDMFSPNDISILQKEYKDLNSIFTHRSNKNHSKRKCKRRLNLSENFESHGNKLSPDNLMTKSCKNGILNQSTESKQKILNTERDEVEDLLSALPSVKNINKSLIMQNIIAPKTKRKVANSIQINKKQLFKVQKRNQIFRNHKRSICLQEDLDNQSLIKTNQAP